MKAIYRYDTNGTLVKVHKGEFEAAKSIIFEGNYSFSGAQECCEKILSQCHVHGEILFGHYWRPCRTTVFKRAVKFYKFKMK